MDSKPRRIQLSRKKGWRIPENTVSVARPHTWGNPFRIGDFGIPDAEAAVRTFKQWMVDRMIVGPVVPDPAELLGKNLACWCPLDKPCHADVLLEIANTPKETHHD